MGGAMIKVISAGLYTTIQDKGRFLYRMNGVPLSGVMDRSSAELANVLLGNDKSAPVLEITHTGPVLQFLHTAEISITGAGFTPTLNNIELALNKRILVKENSILKFGLPSYGVRGYLAIRGGFISEKVLGSYSFYPGITSASHLQKGDVLQFNGTSEKIKRITASVKHKKDHFDHSILQVYKGPEFDQLSEASAVEILATPLTVLPESNRMAYMLKGWEAFSAKEIITGPVQPGTVQLTPSGQCVVLMRDGQTTGGYSRIFQLDEDSINRLSQKSPESQINFQLKERYRV
jgi:biotin-dependent carboxylase-like uncharacterized protein